MEISKEIGFDPSPFFSLQVNFSHFFIYYLFLFTGILILFALFLNQSPEDSLFWVLLGSFLIIFVPVIDFIVSKGRGFRLSYIIDSPAKNFLTGFNPFVKSPNISPGQKFIFLCGAIGGAGIIFYRTKNILKTALFPLILYLWTFFTGLVPLLIAYFFKSDFTGIFKSGGLFVSDTQKFSLIFFLFLQANLFVLYFIKNRSLKFLKEYDFLRDFLVFLTPLLAGILVFNYLLKDLYLSIFTSGFDYFIFPGLFIFSFYLSLLKRFIFDKKFSSFFILSTLVIFFSMSFGYVLFYLTLLSLFLIYISAEVRFKLYLWILPLLLIFSSSSIISHTKSFVIFSSKFYLFLLIFSIFISLLDFENKKIWFPASFIFHLLPLIFYPSLYTLIFFILFFLISLILFKFSFKYRNHPSPLYFPLIILIILPHSFKKEDYVKNISLANFYFSQGDFKRVIKYTPSEPSFYYLKGISYFKKGKYDSAQIYLSKHLDIKPLDEEIYFYYTFSLINSGEITSAYRINKRAFKLFSCRPQILLQKGIIFLNMGFLDNAEKYLKKALHTGFERGITYFYLGMVYLKKREFKKADFYLQKALELEPNNEFVKKLLKSISEY